MRRWIRGVLFVSSRLSCVSKLLIVMATFRTVAERVYAEALLRYADGRSLVALADTDSFFNNYVNARGLWSELILQLDPMGEYFKIGLGVRSRRSACQRCDIVHLCRISAHLSACKSIEELKSTAIDLDMKEAPLRVMDTTMVNAEIAVENYWGAQGAHCVGRGDFHDSSHKAWSSAIGCSNSSEFVDFVAA